MQSKPLIAAFAAGTVLFALTCVAGSIWFGGAGAFAAFVHGHSLYVHPRVVDLGDCEAGAKLEALLYATNLTSRETLIYGMQSPCSCTYLRGFPIKIPPGKTVPLRISLHIPEVVGPYSQHVVFFFSESQRLNALPADISAAVVDHRALGR